MSLQLKRLERRFDLAQYLEQFEFTMSGDNAVLTCPNCEEGKENKLYVLTKPKSDGTPRGSWVCYWCRDNEGGGTGRTCLSLIEWLESISYVDAIKRLAEGGTSADADFIGSLEKMIGGLEANDDGIEPPPTIALPNEFVTIDHDHYPPYAFERGINVERAMRFRLGYARKGKYHNRLIAPVYFDSRCVGFQARWMAKKPPINPETGKRIAKTKHAVGAKMSRVLYNWDVAQLAKRLVLVESPWATIKIGRTGSGTFGKHLSEAQLELLVKSDAEEIVFIWDEDREHAVGKGGYDKSLVYAEQLSSLVPTRAVKLSRDIDRLNVQRIWKLIERTPVLSASGVWAERVARRLGA